MHSNEVIHRLETGVPLVIEEHPSTRKSRIDNDASPFFVVFMYGICTGVNVQFALFGFHRLITNLVARGDAELMANILEDKMMYCIHFIVCLTFTAAIFFLSDKLLRFGLDVNTRSPGEKDKEEEREDKEYAIIILESTFALGNLTTGCMTLLLSDWLFGAGIASSLIHTALYGCALLAVLFLRKREMICVQMTSTCDPMSAGINR